MIRLSFVAAVVIMGTSVTYAAEGPRVKPLIQEIVACSEKTGDEARLSCFDAAAETAAVMVEQRG